MNDVMPGFTKNMELLTETQRKFAEQAADSLQASGNLIDTMNNVGTTTDRTLSWFARQMLKVAEVSGTILSLGNADNADIITASEFTNQSAGTTNRTKNQDSVDAFANKSAAMIKQLTDNKDKLTKTDIEARKLEFESVVQTLLNTRALNPDNRNALDYSLKLTLDKTLGALQQLLNQLGEN